MKDNWEKTVKDLSESHVDWFLKTLRPLLIDHTIHGFKHGIEYMSPHSVTKQAVEDGKADLCECDCHETYRFWRTCCGRAGIKKPSA